MFRVEGLGFRVRCDFGRVASKVVWGSIGIMERKMETVI